MTPRRRDARLLRRALPAAAGIVAISGSFAAASASHPRAHPAAAKAAGSTVWLVPDDGTFPITGHGYGHGHGMSQWGAQGGAEQGVTANAMLDAFYPGTQTATPGPRPIRVSIAGAGTTALTVWPASGLTVTDLAGGRADTGTGTAITLPAGPQRWRIVRDASAFDVQSFDGTTWTAFAGAQGLAGPVRFADAAGIVRTLGTDGSSRDYRGTMTAVANGTALRVVNALELDDYVRGVVPRESPSSWLPAALQVQAVAARSYAAYAINHPASASYDICDTSACQAYGGKHLYAADGDDYELETPNTDAAVAATAHQVRTYGGTAIFAQFSASDGGWTVAGGQPYLTAHADPWDGVDPANTGHTWSASLTAKALQKAFPAVGTLTSLEVTGRDGNGDWGGRVTTAVLHGTDADGNPTSVSTTGTGISNAYGWPAHSDGLRSSWWTVGQDAASPPPTPAPTAPGLVPLPPRLVLATSGAGLVAHAPRSLQLGALLPQGASAVVLAVDARGRGGGVLTGEPTGRPALRVALATVADRAGTSGIDIVRVAAQGGITLRLTAGTAAVRVRVIGAIAPGGVVPVGTRPTGVLRVHATSPPMSFTIAGTTKLAAAGSGPGLRLAIPVTGTVTATGHAVTLRLPRLTLPPGMHGALLAVTTSVATRLAPTGSPSAAVSLAAPTQPSRTSLVVLPQRDRRISVVARKGTVVTATVVGWV
ncbi:MAG TPA: SpoIID/LytB domain-containing protein [Mycobacteriales bacterium]|nr:SpoIID/LytB domain-containing protein [Mycobacteriales bacterium]